MSFAAHALLEHNRALLRVVEAGSEPADILSMLTRRGELLRAFAAEASQVSPEQVEALADTDARIARALTAQRDAVGHELLALKQSRTATVSYGAPQAAAARYLDREG